MNWQSQSSAGAEAGSEPGPEASGEALSIAQVQAHTGLSARTIRYWEELGGGRFHHRLYCQVADPGAHAVETPHWRRSRGPVEGCVELERSQGLVAPGQPMFRTTLHGCLGIST